MQRSDDIPMMWRPLRRLFFRTRTNESGQTLVEFSLILPFMLVLIFALVDFGRAFHTWLVVTNAAREGARAAATQKDMNQIQTRINDSLGSLDSSKLTITLTNVQGTRGEPIEVDLAYDFEFVTPLGGMASVLSGGNVGAPTINGHSSMRLE
jgi:Flp pilus assembly protein TadG